MKKTLHIFSVLGVLGLGLAAPSAYAFDSSFSVKAGMLAIEDDDSAATQVGIVWGMDFVGMIGAELELNTSVADGEIAGGVDYSVTQAGGYAVLMTPGPVYFKGKAGYVYNDVDFGAVSDSDSDVAYGIGVGFLGFEVEYTRSQYFDQDVDFLSVSFGF